MKASKLLEFKLKGERNISSRKPLIIGERIYVPFIFDKKGFVASKMVCLNKNDFEVKWEYDYPFVINNILESTNGNVLICCMDGKLNELKSQNGELVSTLELEMDRCGHSSAISDNRIVIGGVQGTKKMNCLDLDSQSIKWSFDNGGHSYIPLISNEKVYQCTEKLIRCLELNTGKLIWEATEENTYIFNPISFNELIVVGGHGLINIYDSNKGKLLHQIETGIRESIRAIISDNNNLYFGDSSGVFYAYEINEKKNLLGKRSIQSKELWRFESNGSIESLPKIVGESILFMNDDNKLICLNMRSGESNWSFNTKGEAGISSIITDEENIFLSVGKGYLYKLKEEN
ncbi:PQQ-binding-like beta-propeller repeat protein [Reichenbachiella carrageenanivorans]|uniref:PQQ-binding-like beta-propeller repeat protein n=1 Tax=Reichenbachiella carrageenanivorans TaxID=2979869 RepID=A0ABY6D0N7_9BACT|nr:PQQ-binding-like beta-propeller repeat protein [Reichenbachiella carrageenanivorans]UXX79185.1 PQQ-binding-like beta-propeller repeat protein [Reichenbachiella carrageenanivorans]